MNWKPGDMAVHIKSGLIVQVTSYPMMFERTGRLYVTTDTINKSLTGMYVSGLRPIYDGNETVSWESMKGLYQLHKVTV